MKKFIYGGHIVTGGTLDNGQKWNGFAVLLGELPDGGTEPMFARAVTGSGKNAGLANALQTIPPGTVCSAYFGMPDARGRVKLELLVPVE